MKYVKSTFFMSSAESCTGLSHVFDVVMGITILHCCQFGHQSWSMDEYLCGRKRLLVGTYQSKHSITTTDHVGMYSLCLV